MGKAGFGAGLRSTLHTNKDAERARVIDTNVKTRRLVGPARERGLPEEFRWTADTNRRVTKPE